MTRKCEPKLTTKFKHQSKIVGKENHF